MRINTRCLGFQKCSQEVHLSVPCRSCIPTHVCDIHGPTGFMHDTGPHPSRAWCTSAALAAIPKGCCPSFGRPPTPCPMHPLRRQATGLLLARPPPTALSYWMAHHMHPCTGVQNVKAVLASGFLYRNLCCSLSPSKHVDMVSI